MTNFNYNFYSIRSHPDFDKLSTATKNAIAPANWCDTIEKHNEATDVFVCEYYGGADSREILDFFENLEPENIYGIIIATEDNPVPVERPRNVVVFDIYGENALPSAYLWDVDKFGPSQLLNSAKFSNRKYLATFVGTIGTHPVRKVLGNPLITQNPDFLIGSVDWWSTFCEENGHNQRMDLRNHYAEILLDSKFAIAPRGNGPSSLRRWESIYSGAIPILIDDYTNPWNLDYPIPKIFSQGKSENELAQELLDLVKSLEPKGDQIQAEIQEFLKEKLDWPGIYNLHTFVSSILKIAISELNKINHISKK